MQGDVSQFTIAQNVVRAVTGAYGRLDILVNDAGTTRDNLLALMKEDDFVIPQNLKSVFNCRGDPAVIQRILAHLGLPGARAGPPPRFGGTAAPVKQRALPDMTL